MTLTLKPKVQEGVECWEINHTTLTTIDDHHVGVGKENHVSHAPGRGHLLHGPCGIDDTMGDLNFAARGLAICLGAGRSGTSTDQDLHSLPVVFPHQRQHHGGSTTWVVARIARKPVESPNDHVPLVVVDDGVPVGKNEKLSMWKEMYKRVIVVVDPWRVIGLVQKWKVDGTGFA